MLSVHQGGREIEVSLCLLNTVPAGQQGLHFPMPVLALCLLPLPSLWVHILKEVESVSLPSLHWPYRLPGGHSPGSSMTLVWSSSACGRSTVKVSHIWGQSHGCCYRSEQANTRPPILAVVGFKSENYCDSCVFSGAQSCCVSVGMFMFKSIRTTNVWVVLREFKDIGAI